MTVARAVGLAAGFTLDRLVGDPARGHPVAGFGRCASALERRWYRDDRTSGTVYAGVLVGSCAALGLVADRVTRDHPVARTLAVTAATWAVLGGRSLRREATAVARLLEEDDLPAARTHVSHLVGRDTSRLDPGQVARATVESVAENASDAVVAPLVAGAALGLPGLLGYRAINTLDAMVGYRSDRYARFGWASARLDDVANVVPARLTALLATALAPVVGGRARDAVAAWRRDAPRHPSPNAGPVEAAFAGALGVRLGGRNLYEGRAEDRALLGRGRPPLVRDVARTIRLADVVEWASLLVCVSVALAPRPQPRRGR
jgi:adenosylcobinamide-phosphate synthase